MWVHQVQLSKSTSCKVLCSAPSFYLGHALKHWSVVGVLVVTEEGSPPCPCRAASLRRDNSREQARVGSAPLLFPAACIQGYAQECLYCVHKLFQFFSTRREKVIFPTLVMGK